MNKYAERKKRISVNWHLWSNRLLFFFNIKCTSLAGIAAGWAVLSSPPPKRVKAQTAEGYCKVLNRRVIVTQNWKLNTVSIRNSRHQKDKLAIVCSACSDISTLWCHKGVSSPKGFILLFFVSEVTFTNVALLKWKSKSQKLKLIIWNFEVDHSILSLGPDDIRGVIQTSENQCRWQTDNILFFLNWSWVKLETKKQTRWGYPWDVCITQ